MLNHVPLRLPAGSVIPTGNEWIALPAINVDDGSVVNFNVLSRRDRGLLAAMGPSVEDPILTPFATADGRPVALKGLSWTLAGWWIPTGTLRVRDLEFSFTYCAPPGERAAFIRMRVRNHRRTAARVTVGVRAAWSTLNRVTYATTPLQGARQAVKAPWVDDANAFSFVTHDTHFTWSLVTPGAKRSVKDAAGRGPVTARHERALVVPAGGAAESVTYLGVGVEEFSGSQNAKILYELVKRNTMDGLLAGVTAWHEARAKTTGRADLDLILNRNLMFNRHFAWGRTLDTEELVGVTSRSHRYYVCAAWWDRDSLIWSFPALLHTDPAFAREALVHALTTQLRNVGQHSRFIDGTVLEGGFQLDEGAVPAVALADYVRATGDRAFLREHAAAVDSLRATLMAWYRPAVGLFATFQDSQDEYIEQPYGTYLNAMAWKALLAFADLYRWLGRPRDAREFTRRAAVLRTAILKRCVATPPGSRAPIFARAWDGHAHRFDDVPPGSLLRMAVLGLIKETDPLFIRTYDWLHSPAYKYSNHGRAFGLPGSFRVPYTCCWTLAEHLRFTRSRPYATRLLLESTWDGGIISEQMDPDTGRGMGGGGAFATAAGYVATAILEVFGRKAR